MAVDITRLTVDTAMADGMREAIIADILKAPELNEIYTTYSNIKGNKQIPIMGEYGDVGVKQDGTCAIAQSGASLVISEKIWEPKAIADRLPECATRFRETFLQWGLNNGIQEDNLDGTAFGMFLEERARESLKKAYTVRIGLLGDTSAENVVDGGVITNGKNKDLFTINDGIWKQGVAIATANTAQRVTIGRNTGANYAAQRFTNADTTAQYITNILYQMVEEGDPRFAEDEDTVFIVTRSVAQQYKKERRAITGIDLAYMRTEEGFNYLEFDGKRMIVVPELDRLIKEYFDNGVILNHPHRIMMTKKSNLAFGTDNSNPENQIDVHYDKVSREFLIDMKFFFDVKILEDYKIVMGY